MIINTHYNTFENLEKMKIECLGRHAKNWKDLSIEIDEPLDLNEYSKFKFHADPDTIMVMLYKDNDCYVIDSKIKNIILENRFFKISSDLTQEGTIFYNKENKKFHPIITKIDFELEPEEVGKWTIEML